MNNETQEVDERIAKIMLPENQGGDLTGRDYFWYISLGIVFPISLLIWGWF
ncbi:MULTISPECIES: hypothetical protein [Metabacillus]|uniref:Uncharacterized protein n=1 Tax=Metabacillus rhizolycopersici TaxID=2875709 RepID=A0ABS7UPW5_9BACI|nr:MULTISPECIES: hypothetical protein [Metabacillus]MBZ5750351.1 hypothetical protein [Metabacillus rhizolycopersici]MCM3653749.1 hypothetical protein [Metabacillus litoralis]